ncbi:MAG: hypothetical protein K9M15_00610 [Candidatus Marinimicrobia bacterium]|nr:hypothetical protein [Candidatus Neomarinimicrobiota bacterium]
MNDKKVKLVLISFLALFLELVFIRWFPAYLFSLAFFSNIVLIASFLGLGLGFLISRSKRDLFSFFPFILFGAIAVVLFLRNIQVDVPVDAQTWIWSYYTANKIQGLSFFKLSIVQLISFIFLLTSAVFIPIGQKVGSLMSNFEPLPAYTLNVFGSLAGVLFFAVLSFFKTPSFVWFFVVALVIFFLNKKKKNLFLSIFLLSIIVVGVGFIERNTIWSPYYSINTQEDDNGGIFVFVNQLFHQKAINFDIEKDAKEKYLLPYSWFNPQKLLIVGSGTGNDVLVAREAGVEQIDAVEIDPIIPKIGHPQNPYESDSVRLFINDARSFMHKKDDAQKYDMIVYGTLDSHASLSMSSSIRLDNYIYTKEALGETQQLLEDDGVVVLLFSVGNNWLAQKLLCLTGEVFGYENLRYVASDSYLFNLMIITGPGLQKAILDKPELSEVLLPVSADLSASVPTDDWPYLYLKNHQIPSLYGWALFMMLLVSVVGVLFFSPVKKFKIDPLFFLLGAGFLLLEAKSVTTFSLLFGSTWVVNAVVFSAILAIVLFANRIVMKMQLKNTRMFFVGLFFSLIFLYFFPINILLGLNIFVKILISGFLVALPIFFSSFLFAMLIKTTQDINISMGSNLLGAVVGGFFEYSSMVFGLNMLYIIALICYLMAMIFCICKKRDFNFFGIL